MAQRSTSHAGTLPYWADSASLPTFPKLDRDLTVDVIVIGGGIVGLTTAYLASAAGQFFNRETSLEILHLILFDVCGNTIGNQ